MATQLLFTALVVAFCISGVASTERGKVEDIAGFKTYVTGSTHTKHSVILISDIFGYETPNLRMIADKVAAAGFYTVVPDFFNGYPYKMGQDMYHWIQGHTPEEGYKNAGVLIDAIKSKGINKIGAAGFCWGGKVSIYLLNNDKVETAILLHPTGVNATDIEKVTSPIAILGGGKDNVTTPEMIEGFADILETKQPKVDSLVKIFPKAGHGWTLEYNNTDKQAVRMAEKAHRIMVKWFVKHLIFSSKF